MTSWARERDEGELRALFDLCFPGEEDFGDWFFRQIWRPERTLVWRQSRIQAMVQLLPLWIGDGERALPAEYVYAVGTAPECRGQGLAARLLDCARQTCSLRGGQALALIPQQPSLFCYYRRLGYQTAFWAEERKIQPRPLPSGWTLNRAAEGDLAQMSDFYEQTLAGRPHPLRSQADFRLQLRLYEENVWLLRRQGRLEGWAFFEQRQDAFWGAEIFGPEGPLAAAAALARLGADSSVCRMPGEGGALQPVGMALPLTEQAAQTLASGRGYCGLLFN